MTSMMVGGVLLPLPRVTEPLVTSNILSTTACLPQKFSCSISSRLAALGKVLALAAMSSADAMGPSCAWGSAAAAESEGEPTSRVKGNPPPRRRRSLQPTQPQLLGGTRPAAASTNCFEVARGSPVTSSWGTLTVKLYHPQFGLLH